MIVVAGMEGALPSVVGGLVRVPVIAVPTSVGYGASFGGIAALLGMLNSCANGVSRREHRQRVRRGLRRQPRSIICRTPNLQLPTHFNFQLPKWFLGARLGVSVLGVGVDSWYTEKFRKTLPAESHPCMRAP